MERPLKFRPKNETNKRFVLSPREIFQKRLDAFQTSVKEMQSESSEILSATLYGSMVKGTAHRRTDFGQEKESDIDGFLFVDAEEVAAKEGVAPKEVLDPINPEKFRNLRPDIERRYTEDLNKRLQSKLEPSERVLLHLDTLPLSEDIIDREIERDVKDIMHERQSHIDTAALEREGAKKINEGASSQELLAHVKNMIKAIKNVPKPRYVFLYKMFHLAVGKGDGLRRYRKMYLDKLAALGEIGEVVWAVNIRETERFENNGLDPTKRYPRTLAEAIKVYG